MVNCVVLELTDGSMRGYAYPDEESARGCYEECRTEWNEGRNLVFYLRRSHGPSNEIPLADDVASIRLATRESLQADGVEYRDAVTFG